MPKQKLCVGCFFLWMPNARVGWQMLVLVGWLLTKWPGVPFWSPMGGLGGSGAVEFCSKNLVDCAFYNLFWPFLEGHCAKDEYRLCFFWVGGGVIFSQQRVLNELQANFFRELIFWRRYVLANRPLFALFGLCSFVENVKVSVGTANRQATKNLQTMWLGLAKR